MGFFFKDEEAERDEKQRKALKKGTAPDPSALDYGKAVKSSLYETGAMVNAGIRAVAGETTSAGKAAAYRETRNRLDAEIVTSTMSPGGRAMAKGTVMPNEEGDSAFLENPIEFVAFNGAKQIPMLALSAIPGAAIGRGLKLAVTLKAARIGTAAVTAATGGALNAGDVMHGIFTELDKMGKKEWSTVPAYLKLVSQGLSYEEASDKLKADIVSKALPLSFAVGTVLNSFGLNQTLAKAGAGTLAKKGLVRGAAEGFAKESAQEFLEEGSGALIAQNATKFGDDFNWASAFDQALTGAVVGGPLGGIGGGLANIGKPKKIPVAPPKAPDPAQAAATTGAPLPPTPPTKTPPAATSVGVKPPVGPPVVSVGAHTPPPGAARPQKDMKKKKDQAKVPVVESSTIPDIAQVKALEATVPPPPVQAPPEVTPPPVQATPPAQAPVQVAPPPVTPPVTPLVTQNVTPEPIIRRRAQVDVQTPQAIPPEAPIMPSELPPPQILPPVPPEIPTPRLSRTPQILPDLQAQQEFQARVDAPSQGTRYELGLDPAEANNPAKHQAWRRKMVSEVNDSADPLTQVGGDWRTAEITVTTDDGKTATVKAGPAVDYQMKRIKALRELFDCVNNAS